MNTTYIILINVAVTGLMLALYANRKHVMVEKIREAYQKLVCFFMGHEDSNKGPIYRVNHNWKHQITYHGNGVSSLGNPLEYIGEAYACERCGRINHDTLEPPKKKDGDQ